MYISTDGGESKTQIGSLTQGATKGYQTMTTSLPIKDVINCMIGVLGNGSTVSADFELIEINIVYRSKRFNQDNAEKVRSIFK